MVDAGDLESGFYVKAPSAKEFCGLWGTSMIIKVLRHALGQMHRFTKFQEKRKVHENSYNFAHSLIHGPWWLFEGSLRPPSAQLTDKRNIWDKLPKVCSHSPGAGVDNVNKLIS